MKNVSKTFTGALGLAAGCIIGAVWTGLENRRDNVKAIESPKYYPTVKPQDVIFSSRGDAEEVLSQMDKTITEYGAVSVADFCDMVGVTPNYADKKYGWYNTNCVYIDRKCDGYYILHLPAPITINW